jgi:hypothetical protein
MTEFKVLIFLFHFMYIFIDQHVLIMLLLSFIIVIVVNDFILDGIFFIKVQLKSLHEMKIWVIYFMIFFV